MVQTGGAASSLLDYLYDAQEKAPALYRCEVLLTATAEFCSRHRSTPAGGDEFLRRSLCI